jgi:hypothetical protein
MEDHPQEGDPDERLHSVRDRRFLRVTGVITSSR